MTKKEFIELIAEKENTTKKAAGEQLDVILSTITECLVKGEEIRFTGFGTFEVSERAERTGRNPQTGEAMQIAASKSPKFKPGKALKDVVNS